jgi:outer membrane protein
MQGHIDTRVSMTKKGATFAVSACLWLAVGTAEAEFIGLNIGAYNTQSAQSFNSADSNSIDLVDDLNVDNPTQSSMVLILEHPIAVLPNVRYQGYNLDSSNRSATNSTFNTAGNSLTTGNPGTSFDLDHEDIVLYYQLLNNWVDLDMGVDLRRLEGEISQSGPNGNKFEIDETIPLLHLSARVDLPINGLYVGAAINANVVDLGLSESTAQDSTLMLGYESGSGLGIEGGIKSFSVELNDSESLNTNLEYDGVFLNGYFNF